jgi:hypothetical protein
VRTTTDVSHGFEAERTVADVPAASALVENWLDDVLETGRLEEESVKEKINDNLGI